MILVDKEIKQYALQHQLIKSGYCEDNVNGISYDLTVDVVYDEEGKEHREYELNPGEVIFLKTQEELSIPNDILGRIAEKNSRMRQGLKVDGPHFQPGHVTYAFLRVQNLSTKVIILSHDSKIAQIIFEQLTQSPEVPYSAQQNAAFRNESKYLGLGSYSDEYSKQTKRKMDKAKEDIEGMSQRIYANVLTLMGILVAVFSMLTINYEAFVNSTLDFKYIVVMNLSLTLCIVVMLGLILVFINKAKNKWFLGLYIIVLVLLAAATVGMCICFL